MSAHYHFRETVRDMLHARSRLNVDYIELEYQPDAKYNLECGTAA